MNRTERLYRIETLLRQYKVVPRKHFLDEMEISLATFKRDLAYLRNQLNAPIEYDPEAEGYRFGASPVGPRHELPGIWFNAEEIHALLAMQHMLQELQPGLLTPHIQPLLDRLHQLIDTPAASINEVQKRVRILPINARNVSPGMFGPISTALLRRRQLKIRHLHRGRNTAEIRTVSPQRLVYYRDNWYLDAWCHLRHGIRSFSLDAILKAEILEAAARDVADPALDAVFLPGYGIFSGSTVQWAVLRFSSVRSKWVSRELWHPQQQSEFGDDGHYLLRVPYSDDRELVMDILRHMPEVVVVGPASLRTRVREMLAKGLSAMN
jgi:predicted DNA-binding transcriptional regulator YafY